MTHPTPDEARDLRTALSLSPTDEPPRAIQSARTRWLAVAPSQTEARARAEAMRQRGWLVLAARCATTPAAVALCYIVTQDGLDALVAAHRS